MSTDNGKKGRKLVEKGCARPRCRPRFWPSFLFCNNERTLPPFNVMISRIELNIFCCNRQGPKKVILQANKELNVEL